MTRYLQMRARVPMWRRAPAPSVAIMSRRRFFSTPAVGRAKLSSTAKAGLFAAGSLAIGTLIGTCISKSEHDPAEIRYASPSEMIEAANEIRHVLGPDMVSFDEEVLEAHGYSDWSTTNSDNRPVAIVYPMSTDDVSQVAKICTKHSVPMIPYGAGSSVEGNFSSPFSGICVDFTNMDSIIAFHQDDMDIVVQPGVNWVDLNKMTQEAAGLFLPLDPSPTATIGGMISTNCSGTNAFRYGTMKDWVLSLTVVLPDGRIIQTRKRPRKTSAGYNLTGLFVGAEGTLGLVTQATLKLAVVPRDTGVATVSFPDITAAASAAVELIRAGIQLGALEIMDDVQMRVLNEHGSEAVRRYGWDEAPTLFLKLAGTDIRGDVARVREVVDRLGPRTFRVAAGEDSSKAEQDLLWSARKEALWTMTSIKPPGFSLWSTDVAVPISRLAEIITESKRDAERIGLFNSVVGHVGDGNFHQAVMYDPANKEHRERVAECVHRMMDRALSMEGTVSGEHAIGIGKKECLVDELGPDTIDLMRTLKRAVDPRWIMNPGKVFDHPGQPVCR